MKTYTFFILACIFCLNNYAQEENCPEPKKKAVKLYNLAKIVQGKEKKELLFQATKLDPNYQEALDELAHLNEKKANNLFNNGDKNFLKYANIKRDYWKKIYTICPSYRNFYHAMQLGDFYFGKRKFIEAQPYYKAILASPNAYKKDERYAYDRIQDIEVYINLINDSVPFEPKKVVGPSTGYDEYLPMLSPDNRYLYFTRKMPDEMKNSFDSGFKEKFIKSRHTMGERYSGGIPMPSPFNLGQYQGGVSISVNNKLLFITIVEVIPYRGKNRAGFGQMFDNADIFFSELKDGKWSKLESIGNNINTPTTWEAQPSISSDNKTLYFTRVENVFGGDMDIYKSERKLDGSWGNPVNLGSPINTPGDEKSPFMHSDSHTLYFSSNYHIGLGGYDIFYSKMNDKTKLFNKPINIGNPINTLKDEHGFIVSKNGDKAYYGSDEEGKDLNIYSFELYEEARPKSIAFVNGEISNNLGEVPEGAQVILKNTKTDVEVEAVIDNESGEYVAVITVEKDQDVLLTAKKKGFVFSSQLISSNEIVIGKPIKSEKLEIKPIEVGSSYQINDINFATNSFTITPRIVLVLNEFIDFLKINDNLKIVINGYTDNIGDPIENLTLSDNRAKAVYDYLLIEDIDASRLTFKGYGETKPIASNETEKGRAKNRRTEFVVVSK